MAFALRLASLILPSILLLTLPARADDDLQVGTSLVCDTQQQVERFVSLYDGDTLTAVGTVNAEERDPNACVIVTMIYVPGAPIATTTSKDKMFHIVPVLIVGIVTPEGDVQAVAPAQFFSAEEVEGFGI
jgi:hypothetical protein